MGTIDAAEDAAQETLTRVLHALREGRVRHADALPAFVFQTARHVCAHWYRKGARRARAFHRLRQHAASTPSGVDPLTAVVNEERRALVRDALSRLEQGDRDLLAALFYEGKDPRELARKLGVTPGALRVRKHRALARLRQLCPETFSAER